MVGRLTVQERAQIAARYEVWRSIVKVQRWWRTVKGRHAQIDPKTIRNCHTKLMTTGSVCDFQRSGRPSKFKDTEALIVTGGKIKSKRVSSVYSVKLRELIGDRVEAATRQQPLGDLPDGRSAHGAVVLDQSLYVMGGYTSAGNTNSLVIFELANNRWRDGPPMTTERYSFGVAVFDKDIYVIGGLDTVCNELTACEVFHTRGGRWEPISPMQNGRWGLGAALLNESVYAAGGCNGGSLSCFERYDPATNIWSSMADMVYKGSHFVP